MLGVNQNEKAMELTEKLPEMGEKHRIHYLLMFCVNSVVCFQQDT